MRVTHKELEKVMADSMASGLTRAFKAAHAGKPHKNRSLFTYAVEGLMRKYKIERRTK